MRTISFVNQKGGVGKTSACFHLAGALAADGRRVLLIDNDPQASLTQGIFGPDAMRALDPTVTIASLYGADAVADPVTAIHETGFNNIKIVPGSPSLTPWNIPPTSSPKPEWMESEYAIRTLLMSLGREFDFVFIDCPSNLHLCSWAALTASDYVVVPFQAEDYASQGIFPVSYVIRSVRASTNPQLKLLGYLLTMFDKRVGIHVFYRELLNEMHPGSVFESVMPLSKDFKEAITTRKPITLYKPKSAAAKATKGVADELIARIDSAGLDAGRTAA